MRKREAIKGLKPIMAVYNLSCVFAAGYCVYGVAAYKFNNIGSFACNPIDLHTDSGKQFSWVVYIFYAQKFWEFLDTWFFILNKNFRQLTFLHVFHHSSVTIMTWTFATFTVNGDTCMMLLLLYIYIYNNDINIILILPIILSIYHRLTSVIKQYCSCANVFTLLRMLLT